MVVEFAVLGPLEVRAAPTGDVPIRRGLPRTLLIALLLRPGQTVSSDALIDLLWSDADLPRNPANALQIQVSYLRKTLANAEPDGAGLLVTRAGGYALAVDRDAVDAHRFEAITRAFTDLHEGQSTEALHAALDEVDAALGLWRGTALEDVADDEFVRGEVARLEELRWVTIERRMDLLLRLGRHSEAAGVLSDLVGQMPLRERLREQLVLALYRSGRQADALRAYDDARKTLSEELGLDPGSDLQALERAVLDHDPALDWVAPERGSTTEVPPTPPVSDADATSRRPSGRVPIPLSPLIGRDAELARLGDLLEGHRALTLTGPAGAGKTRLAIGLAAAHGPHVWYVDLSPIDDPSLVAPACAAAIGVTLAPGDDAAQRGRRHPRDPAGPAGPGHVRARAGRRRPAGDDGAAQRRRTCGSWRRAAARSGSPGSWRGRYRPSHSHPSRPPAPPRSPRMRRCSCSSSARSRSTRTSTSTTALPRTSPRSARRSMGCPSPSSWPPPAPISSARRPSANG